MHVVISGETRAWSSDRSSVLYRFFHFCFAYSNHANRMKKHSNGSSSTNEIETDAVLYAGGSPCSSVSSSAAEEQHLYNLPLTGSIRTGDRVAAGVRRGGGGGDPDIISPTLAGSFDHAGSSVVVRAGSAGDDEQELGCCVLRDDDEALKNQIQGSSMSVLVGGGEDHPDASKVSSIFKSPLECTVLTEEEVSGAVVIGGGGDGGSSAAESPRGRELHTEGSAKQWNYEEQFKQVRVELRRKKKRERVIFVVIFWGVVYYARLMCSGHETWRCKHLLSHADNTTAKLPTQ